ncbi:MAG: Unknown protein, partial [uncultured Aureispira sp.]
FGFYEKHKKASCISLIISLLVFQLTGVHTADNQTNTI